MSETTEIKLTRQNLDHLQWLRASIVAFQNSIAPLAASDRNNNYCHQFNQLRLEAQAILKTPNFDKLVNPATTDETLAKRQQTIMPGIYGVVMFGVMLALGGLGLNYIIQDEFYTNIFGCCISSGGIFLVMGSAVVLSTTSSRNRVSNLGELYQLCDVLVSQIDKTLSLAIPEWSSRPTVNQTPEIPAVVDLAVDSLQKQAADWQQKLQTLQQQKDRLEPTVPVNLTITIDFVTQELAKVKREMARFYGQAQADTQVDTSVPADSSGSVQEITLPGGRKIALAKVEESSSEPTTSPPPAPMAPPPPESKHGTDPESKIDTREMKRIANQKKTATTTDKPAVEAEPLITEGETIVTAEAEVVTPDEATSKTTPAAQARDILKVERPRKKKSKTTEHISVTDLPKQSATASSTRHEADTIGMPAQSKQDSQAESTTDEEAGHQAMTIGMPVEKQKPLPPADETDETNPKR